MDGRPGVPARSDDLFDPNRPAPTTTSHPTEIGSPKETKASPASPPDTGAPRPAGDLLDLAPGSGDLLDLEPPAPTDFSKQIDSWFWSFLVIGGG